MFSLNLSMNTFCTENNKYCDNTWLILGRRKKPQHTVFMLLQQKDVVITVPN